MTIDVSFYPGWLPHGNLPEMKAMNQRKFVFTASLLLFIVAAACSQAKEPGGSSVTGVFVASTPCSQGTRPLPGIPAGAGCELITWHLTLYGDGSGKTPSTYILHCVYGLPKQGTPGFIGGGEKLDMEGKWTISKGVPSNPGATVYQLTDNKTNKTMSFLKLSDDLLHLLDSHQRLLIGTAAWSYTLNRVGRKYTGNK